MPPLLLKSEIQEQGMTTEENQIPTLPNNWADVQPDTVYQTMDSRLVSFGKKQIRMGKRYDQNNKHIKAIQNGVVPPEGSIGLVSSQEVGYDLKSKVLGEGGDYRFHGKFIDGILHFPGVKTNH